MGLDKGFELVEICPRVHRSQGRDRSPTVRMPVLKFRRRVGYALAWITSPPV